MGRLALHPRRPAIRGMRGHVQSRLRYALWQSHRGIPYPDLPCAQRPGEIKVRARCSEALNYLRLHMRWRAQQGLPRGLAAGIRCTLLLLNTSTQLVPLAWPWPLSTAHLSSLPHGLSLDSSCACLQSTTSQPASANPAERHPDRAR